MSNSQVRHVTLVFLWLRDNPYLRKYTFQAFFFFTEYACLSIIMDNHKWNVSHVVAYPRPIGVKITRENLKIPEVLKHS